MVFQFGTSKKNNHKFNLKNNKRKICDEEHSYISNGTVDEHYI